MRENVHWKMNDKGVIEVCDSFISVRSKVGIERGENRSEVLIDYGPEYWNIDMTQCKRCLLNHFEQTDNPLLLCDLKNCNSAYHLQCLDDNVDHLQTDPWFCPQCSEMMKHVSVDRALRSSRKDTAVGFSRPSRVASASVRQLTSKHALEASGSSSDNENPLSLSSLSTSSQVASSLSGTLNSSSSPSSTPISKRAKLQSMNASDFTPKDVYVADDNCVLTPSPSLVSTAQLGRAVLQVTCSANVK